MPSSEVHADRLGDGSRSRRRRPLRASRGDIAASGLRPTRRVDSEAGELRLARGDIRVGEAAAAGKRTVTSDRVPERVNRPAAGSTTDPFAGSDEESVVASPFARRLVRTARDADAAVVGRRRFESEHRGGTETAADDESIAAAVPVACGRQRFGVLAVAGTEESGFAETTQSGLELLARRSGSRSSRTGAGPR